MKKIKKEIIHSEYDSIEELNEPDAELLKKAKEASKHAYAPYSNFRVGAAVLLENGEIVTGNNQENVAYPSGLCAERVAIFHASAIFPDIPFVTMAIYAASDEVEIPETISPCGACRQVIMEYRQKQSNSIRLILKAQDGKIWTFNSISDLLPYAFDLKGLKNN